MGAVALFIAALVPADAADAPNPDKLALCQSCHGEKGVSSMPGIPSLAGQPDAFIQYQLVFFRSGARKNDIMSPIAAALDDDDVRLFGAYYAGLTPAKSPTAADDNTAMTEAGGKLADAQHCPACHMPHYEGTQATARLADQREDYLVKALMDFKTGKRIGGGVAAMPEIAFSLSEPQIAAPSHFLSRLSAVR